MRLPIFACALLMAAVPALARVQVPDANEIAPLQRGSALAIRSGIS